MNRMAEARNIVSIDGALIKDWRSFHRVFQDAFGFPDFYGRNGNAWIDCMTSLDDPEAGMTDVHTPNGGVLALQIENADQMQSKRGEIWSALQDMTAFVNWRRVEQGEGPVLALSYRV